MKPRNGISAAKIVRALERRWKELDENVLKWKQLGDMESAKKCKAMRQVVGDIIKEVAE